MKLYVLTGQRNKGKCYVHNILILNLYDMLIETTYDREYAEPMPKYLAEAIQRYYNKKNKGFLSLEELL